MEIGNVPWFDAKGITRAVHECKKGKKGFINKEKSDFEELSDLLQEILKDFK